MKFGILLLITFVTLTVSSELRFLQSNVTTTANNVGPSTNLTTGAVRGNDTMTSGIASNNTGTTGGAPITTAASNNTAIGAGASNLTSGAGASNLTAGATNNTNDEDTGAEDESA